MYNVIFATDLFGLLKKPFELHTYGLLIASGFLFALTLARRQAGRENEDPENVNDLAFMLLLWGLIGSRIVFIFTKADEYLKNPIEILFFWRGGLVWYGGFIAAAYYVYTFCKKRGLNYWKYADMFIPYVAMAHAFGRLGCLAAGCCFGEPTDMPWGISFPVGSPAQHAHQAIGLVSIGDPSHAVHATQLYEAGAEMMMFWILIGMRRVKSFHGQLMLTWLAAYPIIRSVIEAFRGDKERGLYGPLSTSQWISIAVAGFAVWLYFHFRKQRGQSGAVATAA